MNSPDISLSSGSTLSDNVEDSSESIAILVDDINDPLDDRAISEGD